MRVRHTFCADWAFSIRSAIENFVRRAYPAELRRWPLLQTFDFEAYAIGDKHFAIIMRDKVGGIVTGPGVPQPLLHSDHPAIPPTLANVDEWLAYLRKNWKLRSEDFGIVLPIHDSGHSDPQADYALFSEDERNLWYHQFNSNISLQVAGMNVAPQSATPPPIQVIYNVTGANARVNVGSKDESLNIVSGVEPEVFAQMLATVQAADSFTGRAAIELAIKALRRDHGTSTFPDSYRTFMSVLADHIQVWGPILAPYLPAVAALASR